MNAGSTASKKSVFEVAPLTKPRPVVASHPWEFNYSKAIGPETSADAEETPYWKRACADPRARPSTTAAPQSLDSSLTLGFNKTAPSSISLESYEPKVIGVARKIGSHPNFRAFRDELRKAQLMNYKGCISNKNFTAILSIHNIELSKNELGTVMRIFRARGKADTIQFKELLELCVS
jgi:hypothetical protein